MAQDQSHWLVRDLGCHATCLWSSLTFFSFPHPVLSPFYCVIKWKCSSQICRKGLISCQQFVVVPYRQYTTSQWFTKFIPFKTSPLQPCTFRTSHSDFILFKINTRLTVFKCNNASFVNVPWETCLFNVRWTRNQPNYIGIPLLASHSGNPPTSNFWTTLNEFSLQVSSKMHLQLCHIIFHTGPNRLPLIADLIIFCFFWICANYLA